MRQIWIDCDPGHDDAMAILTALANPEKIKVLGIYTVGGNQTIEKVTKNAKNILEFAGQTACKTTEYSTGSTW